MACEWQWGQRAPLPSVTVQHLYSAGAGVLLDTGVAGDTSTGDEVSVVGEYRQVKSCSRHGGKGCDPVRILKFVNTVRGCAKWSQHWNLVSGLPVRGRSPLALLQWRHTVGSWGGLPTRLWRGRVEKNSPVEVVVGHCKPCWLYPLD